MTLNKELVRELWNTEKYGGGVLKAYVTLSRLSRSGKAILVKYKRVICWDIDDCITEKDSFLVPMSVIVAWNELEVGEEKVPVIWAKWWKNDWEWKGDVLRVIVEDGYIKQGVKWWRHEVAKQYAFMKYGIKQVAKSGELILSKEVYEKALKELEETL